MVYIRTAVWSITFEIIIDSGVKNRKAHDESISDLMTSFVDVVYIYVSNAVCYLKFWADTFSHEKLTKLQKWLDFVKVFSPQVSSFS